MKRRRKEDKTKQEKKEKGEAKDSLFQREGDRSRTPSLERHSEKQIGPRHRSYQEVKVINIIVVVVLLLWWWCGDVLSFFY